LLLAGLPTSLSDAPLLESLRATPEAIAAATRITRISVFGLSDANQIRSLVI
jgi:hypothetical protein